MEVVVAARRVEMVERNRESNDCEVKVKLNIKAGRLSKNPA